MGKLLLEAVWTEDEEKQPWSWYDGLHGRGHEEATAEESTQPWPCEEARQLQASNVDSKDTLKTKLGSSGLKRLLKHKDSH